MSPTLPRPRGVAPYSCHTALLPTSSQGKPFSSVRDHQDSLLTRWGSPTPTTAGLWAAPFPSMGLSFPTCTIEVFPLHPHFSSLHFLQSEIFLPHPSPFFWAPCSTWSELIRELIQGFWRRTAASPTPGQPLSCQSFSLAVFVFAVESDS